MKSDNLIKSLAKLAKSYLQLMYKKRKKHDKSG